MGQSCSLLNTGRGFCEASSIYYSVLVAQRIARAVPIVVNHEHVKQRYDSATPLNLWERTRKKLGTTRAVARRRQNRAGRPHQAPERFPWRFPARPSNQLSRLIFVPLSSSSCSRSALAFSFTTHFALPPDRLPIMLATGNTRYVRYIAIAFIVCSTNSTQRARPRHNPGPVPWPRCHIAHVKL